MLTIQNSIPTEFVFHPSWWYKHAGITFDKDFFYHPLKRVESEKMMEKVLYDRFGKYGLGANYNKDLPIIGPIHNAAGYLISEMLGCKVEYKEDSAPQVIPLDRDLHAIDVENVFKEKAFKQIVDLIDALQLKYKYVIGDINWSGILNVALDVRGNQILTDMMIQPEETKVFFRDIANVIERFTDYIFSKTGSTSISVNRSLLHLTQPIFLHSQCSHSMIDETSYEEFIMPIDVEWSKKHKAYGIHYCGNDPHRFASSYSQIPKLDFLDLGWGGNVKTIRKHLPNTFLNIRLDPVSIASQSDSEIQETIHRLVSESANPNLTGICCINMDDKVADDKIISIFEAVIQYRIENEIN